jgi:predicted  nucleic acid-binding Zn ribbon protein
MHIVKLHIIGKKVGSEEFFYLMDFYLQSLWGTKQIINEEWHYEILENGISLNLFCPENDSFDIKNTTPNGIKLKKSIEEEFDCQFKFIYQSIDPELQQTSICENPNFLILKTDSISPLLDGETFHPLPLYKIPYTSQSGESYDDINYWERNYERIEGLWHSGEVNERWFQNQLQNYNSDLNKQGIECCQKIEEVTKIPTYYFLFNYREWGRKKDQNRKCPNCGGSWLIKGKTFNDIYVFKCDKCRLISELSSAV